MTYSGGDPNQPYDPWAQKPPEQQPYYGQQPYQPYGQQPYGQPYGYPAPPDHPQSTLILVLGVLSIACCSIAGPFAWVMGKRALAEIDASGGRLGGRTQVNIGYILGIVATALLAIIVVVYGGLLLIGLIAGWSGS